MISALSYILNWPGSLLLLLASRWILPHLKWAICVCVCVWVCVWESAERKRKIPQNARGKIYWKSQCVFSYGQLHIVRNTFSTKCISIYSATKISPSQPCQYIWWSLLIVRLHIKESSTQRFGSSVDVILWWVTWVFSFSTCGTLILNLELYILSTTVT